MFWTVLPLKAMSESMALQEQRSMSMFMAHATNKGHVDLPGLGCHLGVMLMSRGYAELTRPSPAVALGRAGPTSHQQQLSAEWNLRHQEPVGSGITRAAQ